jgi:hypothetical protein
MKPLDHWAIARCPMPLSPVAFRQDLDTGVEQAGRDGRPIGRNAADASGGTEMAHVGTPMGVAKGPATTGSSGQLGFVQGLLTVLVAVTIAVSIVAVTSFIASSNRAVGLPAADGSYDKIENQRGAANFSIAPVDRSYDAIENHRAATPLSLAPIYDRREQLENLRANMRGTGPLSVSPVDHRYDNIENLRANLRGAGPSSVAPVDRRYDNIENLRANLR